MTERAQAGTLDSVLHGSGLEPDLQCFPGLPVFVIQQ